MPKPILLPSGAFERYPGDTVRAPRQDFLYQPAHHHEATISHRIEHVIVPLRAIPEGLWFHRAAAAPGLAPLWHVPGHRAEPRYVREVASLPVTDPRNRRVRANAADRRPTLVRTQVFSARLRVAAVCLSQLPVLQSRPLRRYPAQPRSTLESGRAKPRETRRPRLL